ncbi:MAG: ATP-binding protein [Pirellulaceae bacterium]
MHFNPQGSMQPQGTAVRDDLVLGGRYRALRLLHEHVGIRTLLALDRERGETVIVKTLESHCLSSTGRRRLEQECRQLCELRHLVPRPLLDVGSQGDCLYVVMPFVSGETLKCRLRDHRLDLAETLCVTICLLQSLRDLHACQVLHRNIKPSNVIVNAAGRISRAALVDIGLVRGDLFDVMPEQQSPESAQYMSPEHAGAVDVDVGEASDLYSVGVVLYECLTGHPPFGGDTAGEILFQHMTAPVAELATREMEVPQVLEEILQRLLRKDPRDRYQSAAGVLHDVLQLLSAIDHGERQPPLVLGTADPRRSLTEPAFVARTAECATLQAEIEAARLHAARLVLVEGEAGSGKTRLLAETTRQAIREGLWVLRGKARSDLGSRPLQTLDGIVNDLLAAARSRPGLADQVRARLGNHAASVAAAFPRLAAELRWQDPENTVSSAHRELRHATALPGQALVRFIRALGTAEWPALLFLDDCQWCDELTITLLEWWRSVDDEAEADESHVLLVLAFRSEEVPADHRLRRLPASAHVILPPLELRDIRQLAESMAGPLPAEAVEIVHRLSGGSPFMASAVLRGLVESGAMIADTNGWRVETSATADLRSSDQAGSLLARRIELLSEHAIELLGVGAVLGQEFDLGIAATLTRRTLPAALAILEEARRRQLVWVRRDGYHVVFVHDKIRRVLLDRLSDEQRRQAHQSAAQHFAKHEPDRLADLAFHFDAAGDSPHALPYALQAAEQAKSQGALEAAEEQYRIAERGAARAPRSIQYRIAEGLGNIAMLRGHYAAAEVFFAQAATLAEGHFVESQVLGMLGELSRQRGDMGQAVQRTEKALQTLGYQVPRAAAACVLHAAWEVLVQCLHSCVPALFVHRRRRKPSDVELLAMQLYSRLAYGYWFTRPRVATLWAHLRGMNLGERYAPTLELARTYSEHAPAMTLVPWFSRGTAYARKSLAIGQAFGDTWGQGQSLAYYGLVLYAAARFRECAEACWEAIPLLERTGDHWQVHIARFQLSCVLYRLGDMTGACEQARLHHEWGIRVNDGQAAGISLDIWARASYGAIPKQILETELRRKRSDSQGTVQVLFAQGVQLYYAGKIAEAAEWFARANQTVSRTRIRNAYTPSCLAWLLTCLRRQIEESADCTPHCRQELLTAAANVEREALRAVRVFQCDLPHVLRECAYLQALRGRPRRARRLIQQSLRLAERQEARHEYAQSLLARGRIGLELGWPDAEQHIAEAQAQLEEFSSQTAHPRRVGFTSKESATLSLVDRFGTVLDSGRKIAAALSPHVVFGEVRSAALHLLRGEHCQLLRVQQDRNGLAITPLDDDDETPYQRTLVEQAIQEGRSLAFSESSGPLGPRPALTIPEGSSICVPIFQRGRPVACVYVTHRHVRGLFGPDEVRLANFIATIAGAALENAEGFQQLQRLNETLEQRVADRTAAAEMRTQQLAQTNDELERIAHELLMTEEHLREAMQAAEAANLAKSQFLATMSHEIRTPMNGVIGMTELARQTALNSQQRDYLLTLSQSADSLMHLLNDILDISKIEAGKMDLECTPMVIRDVVLDAVRSWMAPAAQKGLEILCQIAPAVPAELMGDAGRLRQIVVNLVGNATKFTPQGEIVVDVSLDQLSSGSVQLHFSVQDTGIGIPAAKQTRIFESFSQADVSTTRRFGGTGLGLAISAQLVNLMGGRIWVDSQEGRGSTFHFTAQFALPPDSPLSHCLAPPAKSRELDGVLHDVWKTEIARATGRPSAAKASLPCPRTVLLAEDCLVNQEVAVGLLELQGHSVYVVSNGREAIDAARQQAFDIVLMDVEMPELDGLQATRRIRELEKDLGRHTPIVAMTAHAVTDFQQKCLEAGMDDYITKPIDPQKLARIMAAVIPHRNCAT